MFFVHRWQVGRVFVLLLLLLLMLLMLLLLFMLLLLLMCRRCYCYCRGGGVAFVLMTFLAIFRWTHSVSGLFCVSCD